MNARELEILGILSRKVAKTEPKVQLLPTLSGPNAPTMFELMTVAAGTAAVDVCERVRVYCLQETPDAKRGAELLQIYEQYVRNARVDEPQPGRIFPVRQASSLALRYLTPDASSLALLLSQTNVGLGLGQHQDKLVVKLTTIEDPELLGALCRENDGSFWLDVYHQNLPPGTLVRVTAGKWMAFVVLRPGEEMQESRLCIPAEVVYEPDLKFDISVVETPTELGGGDANTLSDSYQAAGRADRLAVPHWQMLARSWQEHKGMDAAVQAAFKQIADPAKAPPSTTNVGTFRDRLPSAGIHLEVLEVLDRLPLPLFTHNGRCAG